jgi:hypothetical protein
MLSRSKTYSVGISLSVAASIFAASPAHAIYEGYDANGDKLVSATYMGNGCSVAPIAKRLLVMAQHCPAIPNQTKYVYPGEPANSNNTVTALKTFVPQGEFKGGREYDIMIVVVDKDLPLSDNLLIATEQDVQRFIANNNEIVTYGFGLTESKSSSTTAKKAVFKMFEGIDGAVSSSYKYSLSLTPVNGKQEVCNGDSGGPSYVFDSDKIYYIGATIASNKMNGCGSDQHLAPIARVQTLYPFLDIFKNASDWVLQTQPKSDTIVEPKQETITAVAKPVVKKKVVIKKPVKKTTKKK